MPKPDIAVVGPPPARLLVTRNGQGVRVHNMRSQRPSPTMHLTRDEAIELATLLLEAARP